MKKPNSAVSRGALVGTRGALVGTSSLLATGRQEGIGRMKASLQPGFSGAANVWEQC